MEGRSNVFRISQTFMAACDTGFAGVALHISGAFPETSASQGVYICTMDAEGKVVHVVLQTCTLSAEDFCPVDGGCSHGSSEVIGADGKDRYRAPLGR